MTTPKLLTVVFSQDAAVIRVPRKEKRMGQGWDVKRNVGRGLRSDTGREIKRNFVSKM